MSVRRRVAIALDVGGTKIAGALVTRDARIVARHQVGVDARGGSRAVRQVLALAERLAAEGDALGVGVAVPAVIDRARRTVVWAPNIRGWRRVALAELLERSLGLPALLEQDGHAAAIGESWRGAARGVRNVVMLVIGTGIGGGMILDGRPYRGSDGLAGAAGWFTAGQSPCRSGLRLPGLESLVAGPGIAHRAGVASGRSEEVFAAAAAGDEVARQIVAETAEVLGLAIADVVSLLNPDLIVLGGGVGAGAADQLLPRIRQIVRACAQPVSARRVRIERSRLGSDAGLLGVAHEVFQRCGNGAGPEEERRHES